MAPRTLIITPTYNERDNLAEFVGSVLAMAPDAHVLVVDDASPDGTGALGDELAARDGRVHVLHRAEKRGLGTAYLDGFQRALDGGYDVAFEMDADLSHDPRYLPAFLDAIAQGADVVLGSRNMPGGGVVGWGLGRHVLSKGGSLYARTILGVGVRDLTTGYKAFTRRALLSLDLGSVRSNGYAFQIETTYRALRKGLRVVEVPIVFVDRRAGRSKMSRRIFAEAIVEVFRLKLDAARGRI
ncbi:polyprenol monophosphomannose synthase [Sorangium sp. So ce1000]|uniref:polyprenol monophosphomannose synthase n=1 Tax=Sorangium sp. So ce1000 TaxID=3133325 RepID=UPI003F5EB137